MQKGVESKEQPVLNKSLDNPEMNPRKAATRVKEMHLHVEMMRNRFKVLEGHDQYQQFKTVDQSWRIEHHNSVHLEMEKEKEQLRKEMIMVHQTIGRKEKNQHLRTQIQSNIKEARKNLLEDRQDRSQRVNSELADN